MCEFYLLPNCSNGLSIGTGGGDTSLGENSSGDTFFVLLRRARCMY